MNYYTVLSSEGGLLIGTVFNSQTNQEIYKTKPYATTSQVTRDVNNFLAITLKNESTNIKPQQNQNIVNIVKATASALPRTGQRRCCGR